MIINHNIAALNTYNRLAATNTTTNKALEKLSSGLRINRSGDDAAGLAISEKMRGQIRGLDQATRNAQDGISLIQTAEGALNETHSILQRMRELAVQAGTDSNTAEDRAQLQKEIDQLTEEIDRIANNTEFNTKKLLNGEMGAGVANATAAVLSGTVLLKASGGGNALTTTTLEALADAAGNVFKIATGDTITVTSKQGTQYLSLVYTVGANDTMGDLLGAIDTAFTGMTTSMVGNAIVVAGVNNGEANDIGPLTFMVKDSSGNVRNAASEKLSAIGKAKSAKDAQADGTQTFLIGANAGQSLTMNIEKMNASALGVQGLKVATQSQANLSITVIDAAIKTVSTERSKLGAVQNRLEHTINNLGTASENLTAAESRIRDVDMAKEMMNFTKSNIISQAATAMLAQANQQPQGVLQLLR